MFNTKPTEKTELDHLIDAVTAAMRNETKPGSDEYQKLLDQLVKLEQIKKDNRPDRLSIDTKAAIFANLAGLGLIMNHERAHVITTKAWALLSRAAR